jgi:hypothetical protein
VRKIAEPAYASVASIVGQRIHAVEGIVSWVLGHGELFCMLAEVGQFAENVRPVRTIGLAKVELCQMNVEIWRGSLDGLIISELVCADRDGILHAIVGVRAADSLGHVNYHTINWVTGDVRHVEAMPDIFF